MEAIQKEYERLIKRANLSKSINDVDHCLRLLENAREAILRGLTLCPSVKRVVLTRYRSDDLEGDLGEAATSHEHRFG